MFFHKKCYTVGVERHETFCVDTDLGTMYSSSDVQSIRTLRTMLPNSLISFFTSSKDTFVSQVGRRSTPRKGSYLRNERSAFRAKTFKRGVSALSCTPMWLPHNLPTPYIHGSLAPSIICRTVGAAFRGGAPLLC